MKNKQCLVSKDYEKSLEAGLLRTSSGWLWHCYAVSGDVMKRGVDVASSALALILLSPLMLAVAVAIKLTDFGPVLFWQTRIGKWGQPFRFPKFRSMVIDAEARMQKIQAQNVHGNGLTFKIKKDPRVTRIGRLIRKTSIDELPQLWCVLKGEMSLVGPRPPLVREVEKYSLHHRSRLEVTPGLTCTWQVSGRSDIPFDRQLEMDIEYIQKRGFWNDIKLILKTIPAVILGKGAY